MCLPTDNAHLSPGNLVASRPTGVPRTNRKDTSMSALHNAEHLAPTRTPAARLAARPTRGIIGGPVGGMVSPA